MLYALAFLAGIVAGSRALTAPAAVSWAAHLGSLNLEGSWLAFMGYAWTPWVFTVLAIVELITDQLPSTPSRKVPMQFGARIVTGALSGATLGASAGSWIAGLFDAIVIGAGQAGPPMTARLAASGRTVAIVERKLFGGTCVNVGCTPTKTLVASAYAAHLARRAAEYGVTAGPVGVDFASVMARMDRVVDEKRAGLKSWLGGMANCTVVEGHARFTSPHAIEVGG